MIGYTVFCKTKSRKDDYMKAYAKLTAEERREEYARLQKEFEALKAQEIGRAHV